MKIVLALLLLGVTALASEASDHQRDKPAIIGDGSAAKSYISKALYEYLDKPPYLAIRAATPFASKEIEGKTVWISLVDFYCGLSKEEKVHCVTVIVYDPVTNQHHFLNPDELGGSSGEGTSDEGSTSDDGSI